MTNDERRIKAQDELQMASALMRDASELVQGAADILGTLQVKKEYTKPVLTELPKPPQASDDRNAPIRDFDSERDFGFKPTYTKNTHYLKRQGETIIQTLVEYSRGSPRVLSSSKLPRAKGRRLTQTLEFDGKFDYGRKSKSGKIGFGLGGGTAPSGGKINAEGWTLRPVWTGDGDVGLYSYQADRPLRREGNSYGVVHSLNFTATRGEAFELTFDVHMNDPHKSNGLLIGYINGKETLKVNNIKWSESDPIIDRIMYAGFHGGNTIDWAPQRVNTFRVSNWLAEKL